MRGAHVRKRKNKNGYVYQIVIELDQDAETGKRNRIFKTLPEDCTKKDAEKIMRQMLSDLDNQTYVKDSNITVEKFLREWLDTYILPHKSPTTAETYVYNVENYIIPKFGKVRLQDLSTIEIQKWYNELAVKSPLSNRPLTPKTIRNIHMNFNAALKRAVQLELIKKNPGENVELLKCKQYTAEVYDSEELQKLIEAIKGTDIEIGIMILICLGLRRGELMALRYSDIDFDNSTVTINKSVVRVKRQALTKDPKSESGKRKIEAPDILMKLLHQERIDYMKRKLQYGAKFQDNDLVICQPDGSPYKSPDYYTHKFKQFLEVNGLKRIRLHDLRHTNATMMLRLGVSAKVMQKRLGHSSFNITMDTYSHVLDDMGKEAAEKLEAGLQAIIV